MKFRFLGACAAAVLAMSVPAGAQTYPSKPIRIITPYVAGGAADITARVLGQKLSESMGQPVIIENKAGANGGIGTEAVAKAAPDGYTLLLVASGPIVVNLPLTKKLPYDPVKDLEPISHVTNYFYVLVARQDSPFKTLQDIIAAAKSKPGDISYGSTGLGGGNHLAGEMLALMTGTKLNHVPYKGSAAAFTDLIGGTLSVMFDTVITSVPYVADGRLRAFGVSSNKRSSALPNVPTLDEQGLKGFNLTQWQGLMAPKGTDKAIIDKLNAEVLKALKAPEVIERLGKQGGNEIVGSTPEAFAALIKSDLEFYTKLITDAGIKPE